MSPELSIWNLEEESEVIVTAFCPTMNEQHVKRFNELGFRMGEPVKCVQRTPLGAPRIFQVNSTVFSLSKEDASRIYFTALHEHEIAI
ncbi:ferrous iron transport protein A [bacterium]|nr:ferrous iron transport protein A [bacterium]